MFFRRLFGGKSVFSIGSMSNIMPIVAIIIDETRQYDYYRSLIRLLSPDDVILIVNDYHETTESHNVFFEEFGEYTFLMLSKVVSDRLKFSVLLSTGNFLIPASDVGIIKLFFHCFVQRLVYLYSVTVGFFLEKSHLAHFFSKIVGRDLSAKGHRSLDQLLCNKIYPERLVGQYNILYPRGLDLPKEFPTRSTRKSFDFIFTIGGYDSYLVEKNSDFGFMKIGYPRYDKKDLPNSENRLLNDDINVDQNKKTILWMPSRLDWLADPDANVKVWLRHIERLSHTYNIILRPHPHRFRDNPAFYKMISQSSIVVDTDASRELLGLYSSADLVICDYGGSIFSALYCNKTVVLLNIPGYPATLNSNSEFYARDILPNFDITDESIEDNSILMPLTSTTELSSYHKSSLKARQYFFSTTSKSGLIDASKFLVDSSRRE
jgi:hypothetical protein